MNGFGFLFVGIAIWMVANGLYACARAISMVADELRKYRE